MMEVRCCCRPEKLLGYLPVRDQIHVARGVMLRFVVRPDKWVCVDGRKPSLYRDIVTLPVEMFSASTMRPDGEFDRDSHLALKSEETPIERLRRIPGFVENTSHSERR